MNILVTGSGALLGQGIIRCLLHSSLPLHIIAADPEPLSSGNYVAHKAYKIPMAHSPDFIPAIESIIASENIDFLFVGTDAELLPLSQAKTYLQNKYFLHIIVASPHCIKLADSKFQTAAFLKENNFPYPQSAFASNHDDVMQLLSDKHFPLITKPDVGARSVGFQLLNNRTDLDKVLANPCTFIVQEFIPDVDGEFTSGCLVLEGKCRSIVTLKRDLKNGNTYRTYRDEKTTEYDSLIKTIAEATGIEGPCNFQFRVRNGLPVAFEINARFSGTTPLRLMYGFNEVDALIRYYVDGRDIIMPNLREGIVMRAFSDVFIQNSSLQQFNSQGNLSSPLAQFFNFNI
jgi:carbamoyl-phosphate synthase large subunit